MKIDKENKLKGNIAKKEKKLNEGGISNGMGFFFFFF
jgi:hypothetical protein